ncbi:hypothetical protein D3C76_1415560 [compost metagenome]
MQRSGPDVEHAIEVVGDARLGEHIAHEDEHRQGQHRVPLHQLHGRAEGHFRAAIAPEQKGGRSSDEADGAEHPLAGQQQQDHRREHQQGDEFVAHGSSLPQAAARSRSKVTEACNSMRNTPKVMTILIGAINGDQEE